MRNVKNDYGLSTEEIFEGFGSGYRKIREIEIKGDPKDRKKLIKEKLLGKCKFEIQIFKKIFLDPMCNSKKVGDQKLIEEELLEYKDRNQIYKERNFENISPNEMIDRILHYAFEVKATTILGSCKGLIIYGYRIRGVPHFGADDNPTYSFAGAGRGHIILSRYFIAKK